MRESAESILLVLPSDHVITGETAFVEAAEAAAEIAKDGYLVAFGIAPTAPHFGYGYIRAGAQLDGDTRAFAVDTFVEKPDKATAQRFLGEGGYFWNSGMFMLRASTIMEELRLYEPEIAVQAELALDRAKLDNDFTRLDAKAFTSCQNVSIDHAVMEKTQRAAVIATADLGWNDIGSWTTLADIPEHDA